MKKIIAAALCLTIASPCLAAGRYDYRYPHHGYNMPPRPHYRVEHYHYRYQQPYKPCSQRTKTLAAVAGVGIAAAIISAIVD